MMRVQYISVSICLSFFALCHGYPGHQPVIGILTETAVNGYRQCTKGQYVVQAAYQTFIEEGGGAAVPLFVSQSDEYYENIIPRLNGVLLPGGGAPLLTSPYAKAAYKVFNMAMALNNAGIHFPIWGTCLGSQEMTTWPFLQKQNPVGKCNGTEDVSLPLNFTTDAANSKLYSPLPDAIRNILSKENVTANFHHACLTMKTYNSFKELNSFYTILSTNVDKLGVEFVSSFEAKEYPFYGVQFHPEKNNLLHPIYYQINQSLHAVIAGQYFANFLVEQARQNNHTFSSTKEEMRFLINSYPSHYDDYFEYYCFSDADVPDFDN